MSFSKPILISVVGPTAVGKTALSIQLATHFKTEILSVDSRQMYREMEIGTAKPSKDELELISHHFINSHSIFKPLSAGAYADEALAKLEKLYKEYDLIIGVGGAGLFYKGLWEGFDNIPRASGELRETLNKEFGEQGLRRLLQELKETDPIYYEKVDRNNHQRIIRALEVIRTSGKPFSSFQKSGKAERPFFNIKIGLEMPREELFARIDRRMDFMIESGLFDEAKMLYQHHRLSPLQTVGYQEIFGYLKGDYNRNETIRLLKRNSRRYAKRQLTWFKRDEEITWFTHTDMVGIINHIGESLNAHNMN